MLPFEPVAKVGADLGSEHLLALPTAMLGRHPPVRPATHCQPVRPPDAGLQPRLQLR